MKTRQDKIQLLTRTNRARAVAPAILASLSEALSETVTADMLIPLPESDALLEVFRGFYQSAANSAPFTYRRCFARPEAGLVFGFASCLAHRMAGERGFLLTKPTQDCGAVSLDVATLLRRTEAIIRFDGDSLSVVSSDRTQGFLIDHNADDDQQAYEVAVWGHQWSRLALECDADATA